MNTSKILSIVLTLFIILGLSIIGLTYYHPICHKEKLSGIKADAQSLLYDYGDFKDEIPVVFDVDNPDDEISFITKPQALEDLEYLFSLLKYGYAGYEYFGGDDAFIRARNNMTWSLFALIGDTIETNKFLDIIYRELQFIQDAHFTLGNYILCDYTKYYSSRKFTFHKNDSGFFTIIDNNPYYVTAIDGKDP